MRLALLTLALLALAPPALAAAPQGRIAKPETVLILGRMLLPWPDPATLALPDKTVTTLRKVENAQAVREQLRESWAAALRQADGEAVQDVQRRQAVEATLGPQLRHAEEQVTAARTQAIAALRQGTLGAEAAFILGELELGAAQARQDVRMEAYDEELRAFEACKGRCQPPNPPELNLQAARLAWRQATESRMPPMRAMAWYALGFAAEATGSSSEANAAYQQALGDARPALADELHLRMGNLALDDGQEAEARKHFAAIAAPDKQRPAWARLTLAAVQRDRCEEAVQSAVAYRAAAAEASDLDVDVRRWEATCVADPYSGLLPADFARLDPQPDPLLRREIERQAKGFRLPTTAREAAVELAQRCMEVVISRDDPQAMLAVKLTGTLATLDVEGSTSVSLKVQGCMVQRAQKLPKLKGKIDGPLVVMPARVQ